MGAGVGLMWHAQFRVATERTLYAMPETQIGFFTDNGASYFFPRIKGGIELGLYLALTGKRVKGKEMIAYGLATHFVPSNKIGQLSNALKSDKIGSNESINEIISRFSTQVDEAQIPNLDSIRKIFRPDALSAIFSRLRSDKSDFSQQTLKTLSKMSPLALHITFELL